MKLLKSRLQSVAIFSRDSAFYKPYLLFPLQYSWHHHATCSCSVCATVLKGVGGSYKVVAVETRIKVYRKLWLNFLLGVHMPQILMQFDCNSPLMLALISTSQIMKTMQVENNICFWPLLLGKRPNKMMKQTTI